eukprot:10720687-Alexandrium_andersonii.AAC.1
MLVPLERGILLGICPSEVPERIALNDIPALLVLQLPGYEQDALCYCSQRAPLAWLALPSHEGDAGEPLVDHGNLQC